MVGGTGTGRTGYWKSGVWVEDLADPGEFTGVGTAVGLFEGDDVTPDATGDFLGVGRGIAQFLWTPFIGGGISTATPKDTPATALIKSRPGDAVIINGIPGTVVTESSGKLVVVDGRGKVLCIIRPSGVEFL